MKSLITVFIMSITLFAYGQKLPNIQEASLRTPAHVQIDGKATEWGDKFQAYNHATNVFYTIANDDKNLYLIIQVTDPVIINKIVSAGITFTIAKSMKKDDGSGVAITYPVFDIKDRPMVDVKNTPKIISGSEASLLKADSFMTVNNNRLKNKSKFIKVAGAKDLDTLVSVYNREGIKAAELFDNKMVYTYELSVDLKHLALSVNDTAKFAYEIKLNGASFNNLNGITVTSIPQLDSKMPLVSMKISEAAMPPAAIPVMTSTTNFWGDYTLAKK